MKNKIFNSKNLYGAALLTSLAIGYIWGDYKFQKGYKSGIENAIDASNKIIGECIDITAHEEHELYLELIPITELIVTPITRDSTAFSIGKTEYHLPENADKPLDYYVGTYETTKRIFNRFFKAACKIIDYKHDTLYPKRNKK